MVRDWYQMDLWTRGGVSQDGGDAHRQVVSSILAPARAAQGVRTEQSHSLAEASSGVSQIGTGPSSEQNSLKAATAVLGQVSWGAEQTPNLCRGCVQTCPPKSHRAAGHRHL